LPYKSDAESKKTSSFVKLIAEYANKIVDIQYEYFILNSAVGNNDFNLTAQSVFLSAYLISILKNFIDVNEETSDKLQSLLDNTEVEAQAS
jgi:hypothetical protein